MIEPISEDTKIDISSEGSRTYIFPGSDRVFLLSPLELIVRKSGTHRIKTGDGKLHIIPTGWIHIEINSEDWVA